MTKEQNTALYSYYLHFNPYTGYWNAVNRDKSVDYLNGKLSGNDIIKHKDINTLISYLSKEPSK
jgi:hypothetical protein